MVVLLTEYDSYLPLKYKIFKAAFSTVQEINNVGILQVIDNNIILNSGDSVTINEINGGYDVEEFL
jgi:hypothetical protein